MINYPKSLPQSNVEIVSSTRVLKTGNFSRPDSFEFVQALANHFIRHPDPLVVPIYSFRSIPDPQANYCRDWLWYS
jgi:hypothetical protein